MKNVYALMVAGWVIAFGLMVSPINTQQPQFSVNQALKVDKQFLTSLIEEVQGKKEQKQFVGATGYIPLTDEKRAYYQKLSQARHGNRIQLAAKNLSLPVKFDCRDKVPLPMWNQGSCGSCYLVATVRTMTDAGCMVGLGKPDGSFMLSSQYGMDRPRNFGGCNGGNGTEVIAWACNHGWIAEKYVDSSGVAHNDYPPYQASPGNDRTKAGAKVWVKGWTWGMVNPNGHPTTDEVKAAVYLHGRINIALDAGGQFGNGATTITALGRSINHEINLIGWDDSVSGGAFILENQWGSSWGTNGCRYITYAAAKNIVDHFYVSAGDIPPPPDPKPDPKPPVPGGTPPFKLYEGTSPDFTQVGDKEGYATLSAAEKDAKKMATEDKTPVTIWDSAKPAVLIETVQPGVPPIPPGPPGTATITLSIEQVASVLAQAGALKIDGSMTLNQLILQLRKNQEMVPNPSPLPLGDDKPRMVLCPCNFPDRNCYCGKGSVCNCTNCQTTSAEKQWMRKWYDTGTGEWMYPKLTAPMPAPKRVSPLPRQPIYRQKISRLPTVGVCTT